MGRSRELAQFRENFASAPDHPRHRFLFHVQGSAGVGKSFLVHELRALADERGALTARLDDAVGSVPDAMAALAGQFARRGHRMKRLERLLAVYRQRRGTRRDGAVADVDRALALAPDSGWIRSCHRQVLAAQGGD